MSKNLITPRGAERWVCAHVVSSKVEVTTPMGVVKLHPGVVGGSRLAQGG